MQLQAAKEILEKKFGTSFCVAIGKDFSYSISHSSQHLFFYLGSASLGFLIWKV
jgi:Dynein light chain type 1